MSRSTQERCAAVHAAIRQRAGNTVQFGPFAGMLMPDCGAKFYYVLGTYERELHGIIYELDPWRFAMIVNVGAGDGYYAVGLALRHPEASVIAFESQECAHPYLAKISKANGVADRLCVHGKCGVPELQAVIGDGACPQLIVMDCEGDELTLLDPSVIPGLLKCRLLVELHEFVHKNVAVDIRARFAASHNIAEVWSHPRKLSDLPFQPEPNDFTEELRPYYVFTIDENRPVDMRWFLMEPKC